MNLYHIRQEHLSLMAEIEEADGELAPHMEYALGLTQDAFQEKAVSVGFLSKHLDDGIAAIDKEVKRLQAMKLSVTKRQEWLTDQLSAAMHQFGFEKIDTPTLKISFRKSEAVEILDENLLPEACLDIVPQTYKVSKTKIKDLIKKGADVPGAALVSRQNLQIK